MHGVCGLTSSSQSYFLRWSRKEFRDKDGSGGSSYHRGWNQETTTLLGGSLSHPGLTMKHQGGPLIDGHPNPSSAQFLGWYSPPHASQDPVAARAVPPRPPVSWGPASVQSPRVLLGLVSPTSQRQKWTSHGPSGDSSTPSPGFWEGSLPFLSH